MGENDIVIERESTLRCYAKNFGIECEEGEGCPRYRFADPTISQLYTLGDILSSVVHFDEEKYCDSDRQNIITTAYKKQDVATVCELTRLDEKEDISYTECKLSVKVHTPKSKEAETVELLDIIMQKAKNPFKITEEIE